MEDKKPTKCKIDEVITYNSSDVKPALINFEEGILLKETACKFECNLVDNSEDETDEKKSDFLGKKMFLVKDDDKFVGKIISPETTMCHTMIMIRNKETNKLTMIEVDQYNVMKVIDKMEDSDDGNLSGDSDNLYATNRNRLYKTFGSKRSIRNLELSNKSKVNAEIMKAQMEKTASKIQVKTEDLDMPKGNVEHCLPKHNRTATQAADVYHLEDMLSAEELESLDEVTERVLSDPPTESPEGSEFSPFFVSALKHVGQNRNPTQIKCLLYADAILYFLKLHMKKLEKKKISKSVCPFSKSVSQKILEEFTVQTESGRVRPEEAVDKAMCWIVILTVLACKFTLNTALVCPHLLSRQLDIRKFEKMLKVVGLSSLSSGLWMLRTPLPPLPDTSVNLVPKRRRK